MLTSIPVPRLLPTTIAFIAVLLVIKLGMLGHALLFNGGRPDPAMVTPAQAAGYPVVEYSSATNLPARNVADPNAAPRKFVSAPMAGGAPPSLPAPSHTAPSDQSEGGKPQTGPDKAQAQTRPAGASPAGTSSPETAPPVTASEKALLQDLRQRRQELDARAEALKTREAVLTAAEQKLSTRVGELQTLQKKLEALDAAQKQKEADGWQGLAKLYEAMKPRDAATIFNDLEMPVLLQVLDRMKDAKAAAVMAAMNPDKARDVTSELARMRVGHNPAAAQDAPRPDTTGG